jgi:hypothetical protein
MLDGQEGTIGYGYHGAGRTKLIEAPGSPRSTAVRQNLQGMRSLWQFNL